MSQPQLTKNDDGLYEYRLPDGRMIMIDSVAEGWRGWVDEDVAVFGTINRHDCLLQCIAWSGFRLEQKVATNAREALANMVENFEQESGLVAHVEDTVGKEQTAA